MPSSPLHTARFELRPVTLAVVEAIFHEREQELAELLQAELPSPWPGRALIERAFCADLEAVRRDPERRLWGDRIVIAQARGAQLRPKVVGSVIFHGFPTGDGVIELAYGVERHSQGQGVATEAVAAQVEWALGQPEVREVHATTPPWHHASRRVLEKCGFSCVGEREHESLGEVLCYRRARAFARAQRSC